MMAEKENRKKKICLVCSSGGHCVQLFSLRDFWSVFDRFWVTFSGMTTAQMLEGERVFFAFSPTNRSVKNFIRNLFYGCKVLKEERPDVLVTTGAGVSVPFIYIARAMGIKTIYIESITRIRDLSLSGKLVYPVVNKMLVQWPELVQRYPQAEYRGQVL